MKTKKVSITKMSNGCLNVVSDLIVNESPLQIDVVQGAGNERMKEHLSVTMRTQGDDFNLVSGFLFCEGIINNARDIVSMQHTGNTGEYDENSLVVELSPALHFNLNERKRNFMASSACGYCGKNISDISINLNNPNKITDGFRISPSIVYQLPVQLRVSQDLFDETGGAHAVALANEKGEIICIAEDVGRHNAMDKMVGAMLHQNALPLNKNIVLFSGRLSYELVQKAAAAGIPVVCAIGAPTTLAIELAEEKGITVICFLKNSGFNIYCGAERILLPEVV